MLKEDVQVTAVVATYNSKWDMLRGTLLSLIGQKGVVIEIVVTDDGSNNNHFEQCRELFCSYNFDNYMLVSLPENQGTVLNFRNGLNYCTGEYIKPFSPGDFIYSETTLAKWYRWIKEKKADLSFGNYVGYSLSDQVLECKPGLRPFDLNPYIHDDLTGIKYRYLLADDLFVGATTLVKREIISKYIGLVSNKVKYTDDCIYRLIISDNIKPLYFNDIVVWYSEGTGISTSGSTKWKAIIDSEFLITNKIILNRIKIQSWFDIRYAIYLHLRKYKHGIKYILFPSLIKQRNMHYFNEERRKMQYKREYLKKWIMEDSNDHASD